jgi:phospholipase C
MDRTQINRAYIYAATSQGYAYPPGGGHNDSNAFTAKTIFEALQDAGISWKIYVNPTNTSYNGVNCNTAAAGQAQDMCLAGASYMNQFVYEKQIQDASTGL